MNKIPYEKYIEIYNAIILFLWFYELAQGQSEPDSKLNLANRDFNRFVQERGYESEQQFLERGTNFLLFGYSMLVRTHEVMNKFLDDDQIKTVFSKVLSSPKFSPNSFEDVKLRFTIQVVAFDYGSEDAISLRRLIKYLRHSLSHFSYETGEDEAIMDLSRFSSGSLSHLSDQSFEGHG